MRVLVTCGLLLLAGCKQEKPGLSVEENTHLVKVEPDLEVVFGDPPAPAPRPDPPEQFAPEPLPDPKVLARWTPTLTLEPAGMTTAEALREVKVAVAIEGVDPNDLVVEFTAPEGNVFNRQEHRLTESRYHRQQAEFSMPVSGTAITAARMYGTWHAHVFLGSQKLATLPFEVLP